MFYNVFNQLIAIPATDLSLTTRTSAYLHEIASLALPITTNTIVDPKQILVGHIHYFMSMIFVAIEDAIMMDNNNLEF